MSPVHKSPPTTRDQGLLPGRSLHRPWRPIPAESLDVGLGPVRDGLPQNPCPLLGRFTTREVVDERVATAMKHAGGPVR